MALSALEAGEQEPDLRAAIQVVYTTWQQAISGGLVAHGMLAGDAERLAQLALIQIEGALLLARVTKSLEPLILTKAAIIAAKHEKWMERPLLLVVAREGCTIDKADILKLYEGTVARWWVPDDVVVVPELLHTATGKLNKLALRERYGDYLTRTV